MGDHTRARSGQRAECAGQSGSGCHHSITDRAGLLRSRPHAGYGVVADQHRSPVWGADRAEVLADHEQQALVAMAHDRVDDHGALALGQVGQDPDQVGLFLGLPP